MNPQEVFEAAQALPEEERAKLVDALLETLPPDLESLDEVEFVAELDRRRSEIQLGLEKPVPWSEIPFVE